ncbi:n-acetyl transferase [Phaeodactylum tricornutum CCAP 1055/1]|jgi:ribosomal protein S18 acetylase RimI-like enzyme|uniref:N-acetyl transferase n=1 Tax=Phaeodactylum tricornutum (strain CCAP 1055/1) TaxID=556484 RepID=B7G3Z7_PHATC|nr:n-acetyl transferase [Phaeodactylum tricornutum CCAP 1055/1]EEC46524.1 n-acetyl transferase [Phaeodactylum tricornutum CCAP 1055/1]|eukprot:XP_002181984.1 n-acetyl transferase [Phaeodactylum tricornutum CCAP 1055/1]
MKRPTDQAKLLFLGLLRTASALATEPKVGAASLSYASSHTAAATASASVWPHSRQSPTQPQQHITLRLARKTDIPGLQACNIATLPENYNPQFYANHLRTWPELALVAECHEELDLDARTERDKSRHSPTPLSSYSPFGYTFHHLANGHGSSHNSNNPSRDAKSESNIVAYVIGKVEERQVLLDDDHWQPTEHDMYGMPRRRYVTQKLGHVTSLAVLPSHRRQGLAQTLMEQLHYHLISCYGVDSVGLHVRVSNEAAGKLYSQHGYEEAEQISSYYQDGEDAFFMKKILSDGNRNRHENIPHFSPSHSSRLNLFGGALRKTPKPWQEGPMSLRLPRVLVNNGGVAAEEPTHSPQASPTDTTHRRNCDNNHDHIPELLTGTM